MDVPVEAAKPTDVFTVQEWREISSNLKTLVEGKTKTLKRKLHEDTLEKLGGEEGHAKFIAARVCFPGDGTYFAQEGDFWPC